MQTVISVPLTCAQKRCGDSFLLSSQPLEWSAPPVLSAAVSEEETTGADAPERKRVPAARSHHRMVCWTTDADNKEALLFGGYGGYGVSARHFLGDLWTFSVEKGWQERQTEGLSPSARGDHSLCCLNDNEILVVGGLSLIHI